MAIQSSSGIGLLALCNLLAIAAAFDRSSFPPGFVFGTAGSSYQYEGAASEDGRTPSIWDTYTHKHPERILGKGNGDVANDFYHRYKEDIALMKNMNLDAFRFSIAWPRVLPAGNLKGGVNAKGIEFYNNLIDKLLAEGIQPYVTLFHWDLPQTLEDEYGGFLSPRVVDDFRDFSDVCFKEFGDRVKYWITLNEPWSYCNPGYNTGLLAPGRCSKYMNPACQAGDSSTEPYMVAHNLLLSHAAAVKLYKEKYQESQKGEIGITLVSHWMVPFSDSKPDMEATKRAIDFMYGWFMDPLTSGAYPESMVKLVGNRLPKFTKEQSEMVKGSFDFLGLNYYSAFYVSDMPAKPTPVNVSVSSDSLANLTNHRNGIFIGPLGTSLWIRAYPKGLGEFVKYTKEKYNNPIIYITENGVDQNDNGTFTFEDLQKDTYRIEFFQTHLESLNNAIKEGVKVKGYFAWTLLDDFEWTGGYIMRYGLHLIDYKNDLKRSPKESVTWFTNFLKK
ncbi:beta-glucosidase 12 [Manihot esculenta]|uniref:Uncharacterized protein n=1 Tax=Manihot esculenta TaxID=3983 RepID=A0ACB7H1C4_MANES|nr:beta-glucosidase 12 [Manihot esculenta]KAG8646357.1 hypothetical protein MANES_10G148175v8 [Manihot esculenta]